MGFRIWDSGFGQFGLHGSGVRGSIRGLGFSVQDSILKLCLVLQRSGASYENWYSSKW